MVGVELQLWAELAAEQLATVCRVEPAAAAGVEQMVGAGYAQEKMPGKIHPLQRNRQATRQLQGQ
ncbi:hypothetical protein D3C80_1814810 [compost metagenome]